MNVAPTSLYPLPITPFIKVASLLTEKIKAIWASICALFPLQTQPSAKYAFSQQSNLDCHLLIWKNFHLLQKYRSRSTSGEVQLTKNDFLSYREWLGQNFADFSNYLIAKNQPKMKQFVEEALNEAPIHPHFYEAKGKNYFQSGSLFENFNRLCYSPFFLREVSQDQLSYTLPIYEEKDQYYCYNGVKKVYEPVAIQGPLKPNSFKLSEEQAKALPPHFTSLTLTKTEGKRAFVKAEDKTISVGGKHIPRELGTYKLLLMNLGLDHNNNPMDASHPDREVVEELNAIMKQLNHPWAPATCKKEHLIEYAIAELFKEKTTLFEKVKNQVDFYFKTWAPYESELPNLYDQNKKPLKDKKLQSYLPGKEQMLAFCLMKNVQYLWLSAISSSGFCKHLGGPSYMKYIPFFIGPKRYCKAAYATKANSSFMEIWKEISQLIQKKHPKKLDWVSLSGHGSLVSFDPKLILAQNQRKICNPKLAQDLGIAGIDSLHGKSMDLFYKV